MPKNAPSRSPSRAALPPKPSDREPLAVAEVQGLYGPFTFPEKLLQKIWAERDFDMHHAATAEGHGIRILHQGKWNHLGGPDFKDARLQIGGSEVCGDIEVHLREGDWHAHQHARDAAYDNVVLHVVLFPPRPQSTTGANARSIPILTLLPLLRHDLEQYAADAAVARLAAHPLTLASTELHALPQSELLAELARHTARRWQQKVHFARLRIERLGWDEACHHTALEILGYPRDRRPMLAIAETFPLECWHTAQAIGVRAADMYAIQTGWNGQATRPANHPLLRLRQYAAWVSALPTWTQNCLRLVPEIATPKDATLSVAQWRRAHALPQLRKRLAEEICANVLTGPRLDTLLCDGVFPLLATQAPTRESALLMYWKNWYVGDMPAHFPKLLRAMEIIGTRETPAHHGATQGLLGYLLAHEKT